MYQLPLLSALLLLSASGWRIPPPPKCTPVCPPHEVYLDCGVCEGTCFDPDQDCDDDDLPAGCYCLKCQGYVRDFNGTCIPKFSCPGCPASSTIPPFSTPTGTPLTGTTEMPTETIPSETIPSESTPFPILTTSA
ncbi:hypothetical protein QR680_016186 [Steinernema hermaphroditum]|uniref:TIL domain-containing protein n=1 Tax=Steinernema hermaphroditum TaxID=289476 RepID=A0AA39HAC4_9BILA|nr:hypothetical protein QR680_016186 [Steinernema hermaphroditum]